MKKLKTITKDIYGKIEKSIQGTRSRQRVLKDSMKIKRLKMQVAALKREKKKRRKLIKELQTKWL